MDFKLIIIMVEDRLTNKVIDAARQAGATGCTILNQARGEGVLPHKTFLGLDMESLVDVVLMLTSKHRSRTILEAIAEAGEFDDAPGTGIVFQLDVEDAIGVRHQVQALEQGDNGTS